MMQNLQLPNLERRAIADVAADGRRLFGHAVVFDTLSADLGGFRETIAPSAVDRTLVEQIDTRALWNHDPAAVLGRRSSQTLRLLKDGHGLRVEIDVPRTALGNDVLELVKRGDVSGMSFAFSVMPDGERWERRSGEPVRIITDMRVPEVSIVSFPCYEQTDVQVAERALVAFQVTEFGQRIAWLRRRLLAG
jgi:uncharacterized protein